MYSIEEVENGYVLTVYGESEDGEDTKTYVFSTVKQMLIRLEDLLAGRLKCKT